MGTVDDYESEQASLRAELEGEDIHVTVPKEPEVNPEVYRDVEPLLFRGFLTVSAKINDVHFVFKSLNHQEFSLLEFSGDYSFSTTKFWATFLSYGVFMVDGVNILSDREANISNLAEVFRSLPKDAIAKIVRHVGEINRRAVKAVPLTEAYAMELQSRYRWLQLNGLDLTSPAVTGIQGTQWLGLNWAQQLWIALNRVEDRNDSFEREWENAKFVGSCFAGKGLSKVYNQDNERRRKEKEERSSRKDSILREIVLGEAPESNTLKIPGAVIVGPRTVDELAEQLKKDLKGEKDWHDQVIEAYESQGRARQEARIKRMQDLDRDNTEKFGTSKVIGNTSIQGLTQAEVQERMLRRKQLQAQEAARAQISDQAPYDERTDEFIQKWAGVESSHTLTERDPSTAITVPAPKNPTKPFRR
jgi:hypothetical protein